MSPFALLDRWRAPAADPARVSWLTRTSYAHRGLHGAARVENSPSAFKAAVARGLGIECDVQRSRDGQAMVFHDWDLERLTGQHGPVRQRDAAALSRISLTGGDDTIWTLPELLAFVAGRVPVLVELKSRRDVDHTPLCRAVDRALADYGGKSAVMSFDPRVVRWFAAHAPRLVRGLVVTEEGRRTLVARCRRHGALWHARPEFLAYDVRDLPSALAAAQRARGLPLLTWTVRSGELAERARLHADAAIAEGAGLG